MKINMTVTKAETGPSDWCFTYQLEGRLEGRPVEMTVETKERWLVGDDHTVEIWDRTLPEDL